LSNCNLGLWLFLGIASSIVFEEAISHIIFYVNVLMKLCTRSKIPKRLVGRFRNVPDALIARTHRRYGASTK
ncbi:MAG: hypothetical protein SWH54_10925, partial [Thermodesulfobacteriota bacterium]|nr:hypothetical protein [Thermodesulfobacteriota bacterium]